MSLKAWFAMYPGDYVRDTGSLSLVEHGAYTWLKHGENQILERKFDSLDSVLRATVARYQGI